MSWKDLLKIICLLFGLAPFAVAQSIERQPQDEQQQKLTQLAQAGRDALNAKNYEAAVNAFQQVIAAKPDWPRAHYYIGLAYYHWNRYDEALAAYERASRVDPYDLASYYGRGITYLAQKNYAQAYEQYRWLKEVARQARARFDAGKNAAPSDAPHPPANSGVVISAVIDPRFGDELSVVLADAFPPEIAAQYQLPTLPVVQTSDNNNQPAAAGQPAYKMNQDGVTRPTILYKEKAKYTEIARFNGTQGTVVLSVVFSAAGQMTGIRIVRGLPDGLSRTALEAAQKIRFQPALKDGQPVNVRGNLEFTFNLY